MTDENDLSVASRLGSIEGKLDLALEQFGDYEPRIRSLEKSRAWMLGGGAVLTAILGFVGRVLSGWKHN